MPDTFKSVSLSKIATAFASAHHFADHAGCLADRVRFLHVARQIWDACGEEKPMPNELPENLKKLIDTEASR